MFEKSATIGEKYGPAMKIENQEEADAYFERLVAHNMDFGIDTREQAEKIERSNLGYFAGYYGEETRERVERLFKCHHPVFGPIKLMGSPTPEQALQAGKDLAEGINDPKEADGA